jgi:trk system potassium uptake protein TrkA
MYIIIAGGGVVGFNIASILTSENHEVVVIDNHEESIEKIRRQLDVKTMRGNAATPHILRDAEANRADLVLAVTNSDEANMVICFMAKELGAGRTAARIRNPEYSGYFLAPAKSPISSRKIIRPKNLGVDIFINPEGEMAREVLSILSGFYSTPVEQFADGLIQIREFKVMADDILSKPISTIKLPRPCVIAAVVRSDGEVITPKPEDVLMIDDSIYLVARRDDINELGQIFSPPKRPVKSVVIYGASRIGALVAEGLSSRGTSIKLIEPDSMAGENLATILEGPTIIQGDATDRDFMVDQGVPLADAFVAASSNDELNILSGLLARNIGVPRTLTIINKPHYIPLAEAVGIDVAGSPTLITARKIAHFVLSGGAIHATLLEGKERQVIEFVVSPTAMIKGQKTTDLALPKDAILVAITHSGRAIIPPGERIIEGGDHIIIITPLIVVNEIEKFFK